MAVKLQPPSGTELPAFNPILPPAAVTQILLLANPNKVNPDLNPRSNIIYIQMYIFFNTCKYNVEAPPVTLRPCRRCSYGAKRLCVLLGESAAAVRPDLHLGRARAQRERQSRTVSSSGRVGEPIAFRPPQHDELSAVRLLVPFLKRLSSSTVRRETLSCIVCHVSLFFFFKLWVVSQGHAHAQSV